MKTEAPAGYVHATAVVVGETGILIEGVPGSGKSALAAALVVDASRCGQFGRLVGDDRVQLSAAHGRLIARPHPAIAGLLERRGQGLLRVDYEPACVLGLVVALSDGAIARHPDTPPTRWSHGVALPLLPLRAGDDAGTNSRLVFFELMFALKQTVSAEPFQ